MCVCEETSIRVFIDVSWMRIRDEGLFEAEKKNGGCATAKERDWEF